MIQLLLKSKAKKYFTDLKCTSRATKKCNTVREVKAKVKVVRHLVIDPVLKIGATFYSSLNLC